LNASPAHTSVFTGLLLHDQALEYLNLLHALFLRHSVVSLLLLLQSTNMRYHWFMKHVMKVSDSSSI